MPVRQGEGKRKDVSQHIIFFTSILKDIKLHIVFHLLAIYCIFLVRGLSINGEISKSISLIKCLCLFQIVGLKKCHSTAQKKKRDCFFR